MASGNLTGLGYQGATVALTGGELLTRSLQPAQYSQPQSSPQPSPQGVVSA